MTATVRDQSGDPMASVVVRFRVTGSVTTSGTRTTNAVGQAEFCYTGPGLPGARCDHRVRRHRQRQRQRSSAGRSRGHRGEDVGHPGEHRRLQGHLRRPDHGSQRRPGDLRRQREGRRADGAGGVPGCRSCREPERALDQRAGGDLQPRRHPGQHLRHRDRQRRRLVRLPDRPEGPGRARLEPTRIASACRTATTRASRSSQEETSSSTSRARRAVRASPTGSTNRGTGARLGRRATACERPRSP